MSAPLPPYAQPSIHAEREGFREVGSRKKDPLNLPYKGDFIYKLVIFLMKR